MHERTPMLTPYRNSANAVLSDLGSDAARGLTRAEAQLRLTHYGANQLKSAPAHALVAAPSRTVPKLAGDHPARRDRHLRRGMAAAGAARNRSALRGDRHHGDRRAQCVARLHPGVARRAVGARLDGACGAGIDAGARRRTTARSRARYRARRYLAGRGRRPDSRGRPRDRGCQSPCGRGAPDRREHAGAEGCAGRSKRMLASATATTCCSPAPSPPMAAAGRSSSRPEWRPKSAASPDSSSWRRRSRRRCNRNSIAPANASP